MNIKDLLKDAYKEGMSVEDIETALEGIELPNDGSAEIERLRNALSKSNSEAADYKKQLREKMTAEEAKEKEDADKWNELQSKYEALLKESSIAKNKARFLALGYGETLATETAEAMVNGETDKVFANHQKHLTSVEKRIREQILKDVSKPEGGSSGSAMTLEQFRKMSISDQVVFQSEHPDEYKELYGGKN